MQNVGFYDKECDDEIRIKYFLHADLENFYEIYIESFDTDHKVLRPPLRVDDFPDLKCLTNLTRKNTIQYVHQGRQIKIIDLPEEKVNEIKNLINKVSFSTIYKSSEFLFVHISPNITSSFQIWSNQLVVYQNWTNNDAANNLKKFKPLLKLIKTIESFINVDFNELEMPMYL